MRIKKESFLPGLKLNTASRTHGGDLAKGKRKTARPVDPKQALHIVMRSSQARGEHSMLHPRHYQHVHDFTYQIAKKLGVKIHQFANVGNHLHLLIRFSSRALLKSFLREIAGGIAMIITGAKKGNGRAQNQNNRSFWDQLAFTRIVQLGRDFENVIEYLIKNLAEGAGVPMKKSRSGQAVQLQSNKYQARRTLLHRSQKLRSSPPLKFARI
jgi:REP element-mobilizing transposase RayT